MAYIDLSQYITYSQDTSVIIIYIHIYIYIYTYIYLHITYKKCQT